MEPHDRMPGGYGLGLPLVLMGALLLAGCITPPALTPAADPSWTLGNSPYPRGTELVAVPLPGGEVLRGILVPSDPGAPLVVHYAESGGSVTASPQPRAQYEILSDLGFASLAVDYRGLGRSDGERDPDQIVEDALAIYAEALRRVDGDASRLVLRGTSLGALAVGAVLRSGARPTTAVLHAPVRGETVAVRFGLAQWWGVATWLAVPFLRPVTDVALFEVLEEAPQVPVLAFVSEKDELLSDDDHRTLVDLVRRGGGHVVERPVAEAYDLAVLGMTEGNFEGPVAAHMALASASSGVPVAERTWLAALFPEAAPVGARLEVLLREVGDPGLRERMEQAPLACCLHDLLADHRADGAQVLVAACVAGGEAGAAAAMLDLEARRRPPSARVLGFLGGREGAAEILAAHLDMEDPDGHLRPDDVAAARAMLDMCSGDAPVPLALTWACEDAQALAEHALGVHDGWRIIPAGSTQAQAAPSGRLRLVSRDDGSLILQARHGSFIMTCTVRLSVVNDALVPDPEGGSGSRTLGPASRLRRMTRAYLKAVGHPERVVPLPDGGWGLEVWDFAAAEPGWRPLPLARLDEGEPRGD